MLEAPNSAAAVLATTVRPKAAAKAKQKALQEKDKMAEKQQRPNKVDDSDSDEDPVARKLRLQKSVEDADLENAADLFGDLGVRPQKDLPPDVKAIAIQGSSLPKDTIEGFRPVGEAGMTKLAEMIAAKVTTYDGKAHYVHLLKALLRNTTSNLNSNELKELAAIMSLQANEKIKQEKGKVKNKTGPKKAGGSRNMERYNTYDDYDDFM